MTTFTLNGELREVPPEATVQGLVASLPGAPDGRGIAVALEGEVVPRKAWPSTAITAGAHVEVVVAVQGG
jgi:sulfur carrier protein